MKDIIVESYIESNALVVKTESGKEYVFEQDAGQSLVLVEKSKSLRFKEKTKDSSSLYPNGWGGKP